MTPQLQGNLKVLSERFPDVIEELKTQAHSVPSSESLTQYLGSIYGEALQKKLFQRWCSLAPVKPFHVVVTTGFGDGSHVGYMLQKLPKTSRLCILEADVAHLLAVLNQKDVTDLLADPRLILLTPFYYREIITRLNVELIGIQSASSFIYTPIYEKNPGLYKNLLDTILRQLTIRWNQLRTDITNANVVFENSIRNLAQHKLGSEVQALRGIFAEKPLVLVGAGPSLDELTDFLREAQGKAVIAVVNSAYRAVTNLGIRPDITVAVDPFNGTFRGYQNTDTSESILISAYQVWPEVPKLFGDRVFPLSSFNELITTLRRVLKLPKEDNIIGDGTVSTTVVNLAAYMGCNEIYLVGQDMAVSPSGQIHTKDSFYTDDQQNSIDTSTCEWLPGNHGELVPVEAKLRAYLKIFENQVSHYTDIQFHNLARTGAKIHGALFMEQEVAIAKMQQLPSHPFHEKLLQQVERARLPEAAFQAARLFFSKHYEFLEKLLPLMMRFAVATELAVHQESSVSESENLQRQRQEILEVMQKHPLFTSLLSEGRTKKEYHDFICADEPWKLVTDPSAKMEELLPQIWALIEGAIFQMEHLQKHLLKSRS